MNARKLKLVLPKGRQQSAVQQLLADAGIHISGGDQEYRPACSDERFEVKLLKAANIPRLIEFGAHDLGFTGYDWIAETEADVDELLDTHLMPVRLVAAGPAGVDPFSRAMTRPPIVASEYEQLTRRYMNGRAPEYRYVRTYGATEVFPPEDADLIIDNTASGATLRSNGLEIIDEVLESSTRLIAHRSIMEDERLRSIVDEVLLLLNSVLEGRRRVLLDMNVPAEALERIVAMLPAMKSPTIQPLHGDSGYAVRVAVPREQAASVIPAIRRAGATDILQTAIQKCIA